MTDKLTAQDWRNFRQEMIAWWTRRPVYSALTGKLIGYVKL